MDHIRSPHTIQSFQIGDEVEVLSYDSHAWFHLSESEESKRSFEVDHRSRFKGMTLKVAKVIPEEDFVEVHAFKGKTRIQREGFHYPHSLLLKGVDPPVETLM